MLPKTLIAPALITQNNHTTIQCWNFTLSPFTSSTSPGTQGALKTTLSSASNLTFSAPSYIIIPPRFNGGLHTAPRAQLVHYLSGVAHITVPQDDGVELWLVGGKGGLVFALDTEGEGHVTKYPSDEETVVVTFGLEGEREGWGVEVLVDGGGCEGLQSFV